MKPRRPFSRRTFLRGSLGGTALALALPPLEAMFDRHGTAYADGTAIPRRFGVWFWGNGNLPFRWVPSTSGAGYALSEELQPFANVKDYLSVVTGMSVQLGRSAHTSGPAAILTGADFIGTDFQDGTVKLPSIDQLVAKGMGGGTFPSLEVGIASPHGGGTVIGNISHSGPSTPNRAELDPRAVFSRLFGAGFKPGGTRTPDPMLMVRANLMDAVAADAKDLKRKRLGRADQLRLDQHLEGMLALQQRLRTVSPVIIECVQPGQPGVSVIGEVSAARVALMNELVKMALVCDLTRVFTYQFTSPASHVPYPDIGMTNSLHEDWVHHEDENNGSMPQNVVNSGFVYFMKQFASLLELFKNTPEGAGNLLDSCCVFGTSCISFGAFHSYEDYPLLVAGRAGGKLKYPGVHYRLTTGENASKVPFTCLRAMGLPLTSWGEGPAYVDSTVSAIEA